MKQKIRRLATGLLTVAALSLTISCPGTAANNLEHLSEPANHLRNNRNQEALQAALVQEADGPRNLLAGEAALRLKNYQQAADLLGVAEKNFPLLADLATSMKAEALYNLQRFPEAAEAANKAAASTPVNSIRRRMEKLSADASFENNDLQTASSHYSRFMEQYKTGGDVIDADLKLAQAQLVAGSIEQAITNFRRIYLQHPTSNAAGEALKQLKALEQNGHKTAATFSPQEQLQRAELLLAGNQVSSAVWALNAIPRNNLPDDLLATIEFRSGQAAIRQRKYSLAEQFLKRAITPLAPQIYDEARLALSRVEIRLDATDKAINRLLELSGERGDLADAALLEAALAYKHSSRPAQASQLMQQFTEQFPASPQYPRAAWELAWGQYLSGNLVAAETSLTRLLNDKTYRERAIYWSARIKERTDRAAESKQDYKQLQQEFPFGFYASWHRQQNNIPTNWPSLPDGLQLPPYPAGTERIQTLATLGLLSKARTELAEFRQQADLTTDTLPGLARLQQLAGDQHGAIVTFHQNRPSEINQDNLIFWQLGFPRPYADLFSQYSQQNNLPEALVLSLAKAESSFRADVKSHAGAIGLMQLMPATAKMTAGYKGKNYNQLWLIDPEYNIKLGTKHFSDLIRQQDGDLVYCLAAYNAGGGAVKRWRNAFGELERDEFIENIPYKETRNYVKKIVGYMDVYNALYRLGAGLR